MRFSAIRCFGHFCADCQGVVPLTRHSSALLAILASSGDQPVPRTWLADLLWDGPDDAKKRHSLSQIVYSIRRKATDGIEATPTHLLLHPETWRDTVEFEMALSAANQQSALELYNGAFLEGFPYLTDAFDDWRIAKAAYYEEAAVGAFADVISKASAAEDHTRAAEAAKRALLIRPLDEAFARVRVEALAFTGESARALRELDSYRKRILKETGSYPEALPDSLAELIARIPVNSSAVTPPGVPTRLVGRSSELAAIRTHFNSPPPTSRIVLVQGEPGIGKTRVLEQAIRRAAVEGSRIFMYSCAEAESRLPHSGIVGLIRDGFRRQDLTLLEDGWPEVLGGLLPELFGGAKNVHHPQRIVWEAAAQLFGAIASRSSVVLAVDDLQWMDPSSMDLITYVMKRHAQLRVLFIGAGRPPLQPPAFEDDRPLTTVVNLRELSSAAVSELIAEFEHINKIDVSPAMRKALDRRVGGRPFFLLQALSHLQQHGVDLTGDDILPPNVALYITRRLSSLSAEAGSVAQAMAVLNRAVPIHLLAAATEMTVVAVSRALDELVIHGIVADQPTPRFSHDLIMRAVLHSLSEPVVAAWHARIAHALARAGGDSDGVAAYHFEHAGDHDSAYASALSAADAAYKAAEYTMCCDHFVRAVRCAPRIARLETLAKYAFVLAKMGRFEDLYPHLGELEAHFNNSGDGAGVAVCLLAHFCRDEAAGGGRTDASLKKAKDILSRTQQFIPGEIATVLWQVADVIRRSGELKLLAQFAMSLQRQARVAAPAHRAEMLAAAALLGGLCIGLDFSTPLADEALRLAEQLPEGILTVRTLFARGTVFIAAGKLDQARSDFERALKIADAQSIGQLASSIKSNYSIVLCEQGDFAGAEQMALESLREAGAPRRGYAFGNLATIKLRSGDWSGARHYALSLLQSHGTTPHSWIPTHVEALLGLADLGEDDLESATSHLSALEKLEQTVDPLIDNSHVHILHAKVNAMNGQSAAAISRLQSSIRAAERVDVLTSVRMQVELGRIIVSTGAQRDVMQFIDNAAQKAADGAMYCLVQEIEALRRRV